MKLPRLRRNEGGFTLIELLAVIVIIGILAAIAVPNTIRQRERAFDGSSVSDVVNVIAPAADVWNKEHPSWKGPYKDEISNDIITSNGTLWNIIPVESAAATGSPTDGNRTTAYCIVAYNSKGNKYSNGQNGANKPIFYASDKGGLNTDGVATGACSNVTGLNTSSAGTVPNSVADARGLGGASPYGIVGYSKDNSTNPPTDNTKSGSRPAIMGGGAGTSASPVTASITYPAGYQPVSGQNNTFQSASPRVTGVYENKYYSLIEVRCNADAADMSTQYAYKTCTNGANSVGVSIDSTNGVITLNKNQTVGTEAKVTFKVRVLDDSGLAATTDPALVLASN